MSTRDGLNTLSNELGILESLLALSASRQSFRTREILVVPLPAQTTCDERSGFDGCVFFVQYSVKHNHKVCSPRSNSFIHGIECGTPFYGTMVALRNGTECAFDHLVVVIVAAAVHACGSIAMMRGQRRDAEAFTAVAARAVAPLQPLATAGPAEVARRSLANVSRRTLQLLFNVFKYLRGGCE